jgi:DNA-binding response OmpR family regulator
MTKERERNATGTLRPALDPDRPPRRKALIVDHDEGQLAFAAEALRSFRPGFDVATAKDLGQAEEWLDTFHPDLLLLDLDLPREAAEAFADRLLENPRTQNCRILGIVDEPQDREPDPLARKRAEVVLPRPLRLKTLLHTVQKLV